MKTLWLLCLCGLLASVSAKEVVLREPWTVKLPDGEITLPAGRKLVVDEVKKEGFLVHVTGVPVILPPSLTDQKRDFDYRDHLAVLEYGQPFRLRILEEHADGKLLASVNSGPKGSTSYFVEVIGPDSFQSVDAVTGKVVRKREPYQPWFNVQLKGRPDRDMAISKDDMINLLIALEIHRDVSSFWQDKHIFK